MGVSATVFELRSLWNLHLRPGVGPRVPVLGTDSTSIHCFYGLFKDDNNKVKIFFFFFFSNLTIIICYELRKLSKPQDKKKEKKERETIIVDSDRTI
jgi:hypothetical protein